MLATDLKSANIDGYQIQEPLDSGGMGEVYKAFNTSLNRWAAIKFLKHEEWTERFKNEAYIQSLIIHPNIVQLYGFHYINRTPCLIMEYVDGHSLDHYIRQKGKLSSLETERILCQVVDALAYLHQKDIIHRDLKPHNFKVQNDGTIKMLDFGIAKNKTTPKFTQIGFTVGTMEYMAPEQFQYKDSIKSDIWSLGVMVYQMVTGYLPFEAPDVCNLKDKITKGEYTKPNILTPEISQKLQTIIESCLQLSANKRISAERIERLLYGPTNKNRPAIKVVNYVKLSSRALLIYTVTGLLTGLVVLLGIKQFSPKETSDPLVPDQKSVQVDVPNVENAYIVLPNGKRKPLPYYLMGKDGEVIDFTLQADGYQDRKERIQITPRRRSYEYNLGKASTE